MVKTLKDTMMKKILNLTLATLMILSTSTSVLSADAKKGQKIYLKKLKNSCEINGVAFASKHTKDEWTKFHTDGKLATEIKNICPNASDKALKEKYLKDYLDFFIQFASDSEEVPAC